jgi:hypothetical protein
MEILMRTLIALMVLAIAIANGPAKAETPYTATLYKAPQCGCCEAYADYLWENGFAVTVEATDELPLIKQRYGVPGTLEGCHTTLVGGYVVEGHVPLETLLRLLSEKPDIKGISLPGMPAGSPGMFGDKTGPFTIFEIDQGESKVYAVE